MTRVGELPAQVRAVREAVERLRAANRGDGNRRLARGMNRFAPGRRLTLRAADAPTTRATAATAVMILRPSLGGAAARSSMVP